MDQLVASPLLSPYARLFVCSLLGTKRLRHASRRTEDSVNLATIQTIELISDRYKVRMSNINAGRNPPSCRARHTVLPAQATRWTIVKQSTICSVYQRASIQ